MKRILVTILSILYMASATGATVHLHYCMGEYVGAGLSHSDDEKCGKCGMKKGMSNGCCKDEHKIIKATDHQQANASFDLQVQQIALIPVSFTYDFTARPYQYAASKVSGLHDPPFCWRTCPIYIQVQNFRI